MQNFGGRGLKRCQQLLGPRETRPCQKRTGSFQTMALKLTGAASPGVLTGLPAYTCRSYSGAFCTFLPWIPQRCLFLVGHSLPSVLSGWPWPWSTASSEWDPWSINYPLSRPPESHAALHCRRHLLRLNTFG